jgi:hypothetical protein
MHRYTRNVISQKHVPIHVLISTLERNGFILEAKGFSGNW